MSWQRASTCCVLAVLLVGVAACQAADSPADSEQAPATEAPIATEAAPTAEEGQVANTIEPMADVGDGAGTFAAALAAADGGALLLTLQLAGDGAATMSTGIMGQGTVTESGSWQQDQSVVVVTLDVRDGSAVEDAKVLVFELQDGNLVNVEWPESEYGDAGMGTLLRQP